MTKKSKIVTSKYVTSSNTDASKWLNISVIIATLFIFQIIYFGLSVTVAIICTLIAILIILHVVIKFSAIFKLESKIAFKADTNYLPFVSIHIACKSEPAEIVNKTVKAMTELDYPNYEVIVINSNSIDKENWYKIQKYVESCGDNYKFVHLDTVDGFKAGALNYLNDNNVNAEVEVIAIVDSDYIVKPDFLKKTVIYFKNPNVGIVQAPQCYYNVNSNNIGLFYEYRSFFAIVMHQAQRLNLVTFLGTMGLIKADLLKKGLKWNEWCITEDVEAGVNINSQGYSGVYIDECLGKGLMPFDYSSLIKQRQRWTYGNMQIIKKDLLSMILGSNRTLSIQQKFAFLAQLVTWFHFELIIAITYLSLNICLLLNNNDVALIFSNNLMVTLLAISMISNLIYFMVGLRKDATLIQRFKAFLVHYGLLYTMSSSWLTCLLGHELGFNVTRKEKKEKNTPISQYYKELIIIIILSFGLIISILRGDNNITSIIIVLLTLILEISGIAYLFKSFKEPKS